MTPERWDVLSAWLNAWLAADATERDRLRTQLAADHPDLVAEADTLTWSSERLPGFLETPALVLAARELAHEDPLVASGSEIGPYRVVSFLARGGMGDVYRATDLRLHRDVALKVLAQTKTGDPGRVERFMHEARVTASLDHPNVVRVYDVGRFEDRAYLVAELLEGETLRARIARGPLAIDEVRRIGVEIGHGLVAAHASGLVHRDLKPENVFLTRSGTTKLLDFGIAKLAQDENVRDGFSTLTGVVLGTAGYLAPEQIRGQAIDARADLFAFGSVLFEMLTATRAFAREHIVETMHAILHDAAPDPRAVRPEVPPALADIVAQLLEKSPDSRFQSASEVIAALEKMDLAAAAVANPQSVVPALSSTVAAAPSKRATPRRLKAGWVVAVTGVVLAVTATALYRRSVSTPTAVETPPVTLAVMPFRSIPANSDSDLFSLGFSDVFIGRLSQLRDVRVLPLTATQRLRGQDPVDAARALGATHVLTVTLQRDSGKVRATPQLVAALDGRMIWSTNAESEASSIFSIQDILVRQLIDELAPQLGAGASSRLARTGTRNNEAFEAHARARAHVLRPTPPDLRRAAELFQHAVNLDPNFADAWAGLGSAYKRMPAVIGMSGEPFKSARDAANRALELEPQHPEALSVLGTVAFWYERDYRKAEELLKRSLDLQSGSSDAQLFLAHLYSNTGRHDEALEEIRRSRSLDLSWPLPNALEGEFLFHARRYDAALAHLNALVEVEPEFWMGHLFRSLALIALERYEEAVQSCDRVVTIRRRLDPAELPYSTALAMKGFALARLRRTSEAELILQQLRSRAGDPNAQPSHEALLLHALGRDDEALVRLRDGVAAHEVHITFIGVDHKWDAMRDLPGFRDVLKSIDLLDVSERIRR